MKITFTLESSEERKNFDPDTFNREEYLEKMGFPAIISKGLKKTPDKIRFTVDAGGIRINREFLGISREELSEKSGIPIDLLQQYEENEVLTNNANLLTLLKICRAMECVLSDILTDKETIEELETYIDHD